MSARIVYHMTSPQIVFLVPYRDRPQQKAFFLKHMSYVMEDFAAPWELYFVEQCYEGSFNRGGMKNAGFRAIQEKYPDAWGDITFVFNDVDCMPFTKGYLNYDTTAGTVKHFYGFKNTLGGIVSIKGSDFAAAGGYPMLYGYGWEDNALQQRVLASGLTIDRSQFHPLYSTEIMSFRDGIIRQVNRAEFDLYMKNMDEGLKDIRKIVYDFDGHNINIRVLNFGREEVVAQTYQYDLRYGNAPFGNPARAPKQIGIGIFQKKTPPTPVEKSLRAAAGAPLSARGVPRMSLYPPAPRRR